MSNGENTCPFCGKDNDCGSLKKEPCWCRHMEIPPELRALVPAERQRSCICRDCITAYHKNPDSFQART